MASASNDSDLWRALKGGANNYGVVSRITVRSFPCSPRIWGGFLYLPAFQSAKVLEAFHDFLNRQPSRNNGYDEYAAGPLTCFTYFQPLGFEIICASIAYTKIPDDKKRWPKCWGTSGFKPLWRYWSTCGVRTLTSLSVEMNSMDPAGRRQAGANVTVKNDLGTLFALHKIFQETISSVTRIRGMTWTLVLQPLPPNKGDPNPLGLDFEESMVIVSLSVHWVDAKDDELARATTRSTMEKFEALIDANKTGHRYRYLNYSAAWQDPFKGYGEANLKFLQDVSRKYDPEGLFQKGCVGGFKLNVGEHAEKKSIVT